MSDGLGTQDFGARHREESADEVPGVLVVFDDEDPSTGQAREGFYRLPS